MKIRMNNPWLRSGALLVMVLAAGEACAHAGADHAHSLLAGFTHPLSGWDHALVAFVVGLIAAQWTQKTLRLPLLFAGGMALGMVAGAALSLGSWVEQGILLSLLAAGALLAAPGHGDRRFTVATSQPARPDGIASSMWMAVAVIGFAGAAHGVVHGVEAGTQAPYLAGVLLGTLCLHAAGIVLGRQLAEQSQVLRAIGVLTAATGLWVAVA